MGKISNKELYPIKPTPVLEDFLVGTDSESPDKRTVSFSLETIKKAINAGRLLTGNTVPAPGLGEDGDFYIKANGGVYVLYGPKDEGEWGVGTSMIGADGADGSDGADGADGAPGEDGRTISHGTEDPAEGIGEDGDFYINTATWEIFGPKEDGSWPEDGVEIKGEDGADGADGREVEFNVSATHIQWKYVGDPNWIDLIALEDIKGDDGQDGSPGQDGREVEFNVSETHIQWKYVEDPNWIDLIALEDIKGDDGADGREVEFNVSATHIQWRYVGDLDWIDLIALEDIKGDDGEDGRTILYDTDDPGDEIGEDGDFFINTYTWEIFGPKYSGSWPPGESIIGPEGDDGADGAVGPKGDAGDDGADGASVLSGTGAPDNSLGKEGDFYLDTGEGHLYGPKAPEGWGDALGEGVDSSVLAVALDRANQVLYVGGSFTTAGSISASRIAKYDISTETWSALGYGTNDLVRALTLDEANQVLYAGGSFTSAGGISANRIAEYDIGTETWSALGDGTNNSVRDLTLDEANQVLYVVGAFTTAGGNSANRIAKYDISTETWSDLGDVVNNAVSALTLDEVNQVLYVGGLFNTVGGISANRIAKYDIGTETWSALGDGVNDPVWPTVRALTLDEENQVLYVGGDFTIAGGNSANCIAKYDIGTETWSALGDGTNDPVEALTLDEVNQVLYVGGLFTSAGGISANRIAEYDIGTETWSALGDGVAGAGNSPVNALTLDGENQVLYAGGFFTSAGGISANNIAQYSPVLTWPEEYLDLKGEDGKTVLNGITDPGSEDGEDGDFYINTDTWQIFGPKTAGAWGTGTDLIGADGADGKTVLSGSTDPGSETGEDGDFYINTTSWQIFGPKTAGAWGTGTGLIGADGADGATGAAGADGTSAYVYIAYADSDTGTGFTNTFDPDKDYIAILNSPTEIVSPQASDFDGLWKYYAGSGGPSPEPETSPCGMFTLGTEEGELLDIENYEVYLPFAEVIADKCFYDGYSGNITVDSYVEEYYRALVNITGNLIPDQASDFVLRLYKDGVEVADRVLRIKEVYGEILPQMLAFNYIVNEVTGGTEFTLTLEKLTGGATGLEVEGLYASLSFQHDPDYTPPEPDIPEGTFVDEEGEPFVDEEDNFLIDGE